MDICDLSATDESPLVVTLQNRACGSIDRKTRAILFMIGYLLFGVAMIRTATLLDRRSPLGERLREVRAGLQRLQARIRDQCSGEHRYVRHHDLTPWCDACGHTDTGLHEGEIGVAHR
jgi:hypothetical protein